MDKALRNAIIAGIIIIALSIAYYLVVFLPQKYKEQKISQELTSRASEEKEKIQAIEEKKIECRNMGAMIFEKEKNKWKDSSMIYATQPVYKFNSTLSKCIYFGGERTMIGHNIHLIDADTNEILCSAGVLDDDYAKDKDTVRAKSNIEELEKCENLANTLLSD